jgi:predicted NBD/HSP70 family sugar kinase
VNRSSNFPLVSEVRIVPALDVGGTRLKSGLAAAGRLVGPLLVVDFESAAGTDDLLRQLAHASRRQLGAVSEPSSLGVACPGPFDYANGIGRSRLKLAALYGIDVGAELRRRLGLPGLDVRFTNDAEAAALAEARFGAGRSFRRVLTVTLGTGLGAALVVDRRVAAVSGGVVAGELYRTRGGAERADDLFSTRGLSAKLRAAGSDIVDPEAAALATPSRQRVAAFCDFGRDFGRFLEPFVESCQIELIVVAGGIAGAFHLYGEALASELPVPVLLGELGAAAGVIGAALVFDESPPTAAVAIPADNGPRRLVV